MVYVRDRDSVSRILRDCWEVQSSCSGEFSMLRTTCYIEMPIPTCRVLDELACEVLLRFDSCIAYQSQVSVCTTCVERMLGLYIYIYIYIFRIIVVCRMTSLIKWRKDLGFHCGRSDRSSPIQSCLSSGIIGGNSRETMWVMLINLYRGDLQLRQASTDRAA